MLFTIPYLTGRRIKRIRLWQLTCPSLVSLSLSLKSQKSLFLVCFHVSVLHRRCFCVVRYDEIFFGVRMYKHGSISVESKKQKEGGGREGGRGREEGREKARPRWGQEVVLGADCRECVHCACVCDWSWLALYGSWPQAGAHPRKIFWAVGV